MRTIDILATMKLESVPNEAYFVVENFTDYAYFKDDVGDYFEFSDFGEKIIPITRPTQRDGATVFIVSEETAKSIAKVNYKSPEYDWCFDDENHPQCDPFLEDLYDVTVRQMYDDGEML